MAHIRSFVPSDRSVQVPAVLLADLVRDAGSDRFIESLLGFCARSVSADFVSVFSFARSGSPVLVGTATTTGAANTRRASQGYMQHYASDVNFALLSQPRSDTRPHSDAYVTYQAAADIDSAGYRRACYDRAGIADRFSYVRIGSAASLSISVYRSRARGCFSEQELDRTSALMPILVASVDRHGATTPDHGSPASIDASEQDFQRRYPEMTAREREVAARARAGLSARQIGRELGIAETTVISHRKSAYARMGVINLRELLRG